jgi:dihydropteroate synthase
MAGYLCLPGGRRLDLSAGPIVMAVVNRTDDSFYAPSRATAAEAVERALAAVADGAAVVDVGGESSRPGAAYVDEATELERVIPVVEGIRRASAAPISVDTRKSAVAAAALAAGADIVNDISALEDDPGIGRLCAERGAALVLMHKRGAPSTMQLAPAYDDVVAEVVAYLRAAADRARAAGVRPESIVLDPGIGFGKRLEDNLDLIAGLAELEGAGYPVLVGLSRKSFVGMITGRPAEGRLAGTLAATWAALDGGAAIVRTHDVAATVDLIAVRRALADRRGLKR